MFESGQVVGDRYPGRDRLTNSGQYGGKSRKEKGEQMAGTSTVMGIGTATPKQWILKI